MRHIKILCFIICICLGYQSVRGQYPDNKNIQLSVEVKSLDSQYVMIPKLEILDNNTEVQIHKRLYFNNESNPNADCIFYLQKLVGRAYVNMYLVTFRHPLPDDDFLKFRNYRKNDSLKDTINLQHYIPLEIGEYRLSILFNYYSKGTKHTLATDWITFLVNFKPKRSIFD